MPDMPIKYKYLMVAFLFVTSLEFGYARAHTSGNTAAIYQIGDARTGNTDTTSIPLRLGKYNIYSGIPSMYIGRFELKPGGQYIVALSSDEDSYATGTYQYNPATNTIEWKTGFFWQKKWGGKITNLASSGNIRIQFSRVTYGDSAGN